jgi:hypothetical protein
MLFGMRVNEESTAPGSFVASGLPVPRMSNLVTFLVWSVMVALLISGMFAISRDRSRGWARGPTPLLR